MRAGLSFWRIVRRQAFFISDEGEELRLATKRKDDLSQNRSWTATGDMLLVQLICEKHTLGDICSILNRSEISVRNRLKHLRCNRRSLVPVVESMRRADIEELAWSNFHGVRTGRVRFR